MISGPALPGRMDAAGRRGDAAELPPMIIIQGRRLKHPAVYSARVRGLVPGSRVHVELELFEGMPHGFANIPGPESDRAIELMKGFIARQLSHAAVTSI